MERNISIGGRWLDLAQGPTGEMIHLAANLVCDPLDISLADAAAGRLETVGLDASTIGFEPIPIDQIGPRIPGDRQ